MLFKPGENCCSVARAGRVALLVDADAYFEAFRRAAELAQHSILILAWDFNSRTLLKPGEAMLAAGDFLSSLAARRRGLHVRILDWDFPLLFGADREFPPIFGLGWKPHRRVHFRYDATHPLAGSQHQKIAVIDDQIAFVGGLDVTVRRWDTPEHKPNDPRRMVNGTAYPPFHDVMVAVDGDAAEALVCIARERWQQATGEKLKPVRAKGDAWPESLKPAFRDVEVGISCTTPAVAGRRGTREVERLFLDMIARAQRYIFIENQYFTSHSIGDALATRLAEPNGPEIVVITRLLSHGWLEEVTMHALRTRLVRALRAADRHGRLHVYYPHREGLAPGTCVDIHSKVMIVDDQWLRIGSANVSNRSMGLDSECDVTVDAGRNKADRATVRRFRDELLAEHLGRTVPEVETATREHGSMNAAVAALQREDRTLKPLEDLPEYSDSALAAIAVADPEKPVSLETLVEQFAPGVEVRPAIVTWNTALLAGAALLAVALVWRFTPLADLASGEAMAAWVAAFGQRWWALPAVILAYTPASIVIFPRALLTVAAVLAFGPWVGFLCAVSGNLLAAALTYLAGRVFRRDMVRAIAGTRLNMLSRALRQRGLLAITAIRLVPVAPFAVENVVAGAIHIRARDYMLGTFFGMLPGELASAIFGQQLQAALLESSDFNWWLIAGVAALLALAAVGVRRFLLRIETAGASPSRLQAETDP